MRDPKARTIAKYDSTVLFDPNEKMAPVLGRSIKHMARIAEKLSVDVEPISKRAVGGARRIRRLFIRETTSIDNHTYRFAGAAWAGGHAGDRRSDLHDPVHQQGVPDGAGLGLFEPGGDARRP